MPTAAPVRVGVVGLGTIGHHHAERLSDMDGVSLVGGMDVDADARAEFDDAFAAAESFADADDLFAAVDAVVVGTPNRYHERYAVAALDAGLDVLVEKPLAHTVEAAERIAAAAADADGFCMVGFDNRFAEAVEVLKHYQRQGRFGDVRHVEANYVRRRGIPGLGTWFTDRSVAGGGALIDIGIHAVDLALYFLEYPTVVEVSGVTRSDFGGRDDYAAVGKWRRETGTHGFDVDDSASAFIRGADGRTVSLEVAWATNRPGTDEYYVRGTDGGALYDRGSYDLTIYEAGRGGSNHLSDTSVETDDNDTHAAELDAFVAGVRSGIAPDLNTVEQGLAVQRVVDAIYQSAADGAAVRLDE